MKDLGGKIAGRLGSNAVRAGARQLASTIKANAPVDTGALRKSIVVREDAEVRRAGGSERVATVQVRAFYARFLELGTAHQPARPFVRPALDTGAQAAVDKIVQNLGAGIERETAKNRGR